MSGSRRQAQPAGGCPLLWGLVCQARCVDGCRWLCLRAASLC